MINGTGVGEYDAGHIEAENFMKLEGGAHKQHLAHLEDAFVVTIEDPSTAALHYPNVMAGEVSLLALRVANRGTEAATVTARMRRGGTSTTTNSDLATCTVPPTGGAFAQVTCPLLSPLPREGRVDVVLTFEGGAAAHSSLQVDSFSFM